MNKIRLKNIRTRIINIEKRVEKLPKILQATFFIYAILVSIIFGIMFGIMINSQNLNDIKNIQNEKNRLEQKSIRSIIDKK